MKKGFFSHLLFIIIFNFNTIGLPFGVMWSNIFAPGMVVWLLLKKKIIYLFASFSLLIIYGFLQYLTIEIPNKTSYFLSASYFYSSVIVGIFIYVFLNLKTNGSVYVENLLMAIIKINIFLTLIALVLYFTPFKEYFWIVSTNINSYGEIRLKLFFYEPAHLGFVLAVFMIYLFLNTLFYSQRSYLIAFIFTFISLFLTKSLGTIGAIGIAFSLASFILFIPLIKKFYKKLFLFFPVVLLILSLISDVFMYRIDKFLEGEDNSGNVRLIYATQSAYNMIEKYNYFFGVGFGQTKEYLLEFTGKILGYGSDRLPNTFAATLATVGIVGITLKFLFLIYFFIKTRVYQNILRLTIFIYVILYGFSGGWMLNVYEFILLALAFSPAFSKFDKKIIFSKNSILSS